MSCTYVPMWEQPHYHDNHATGEDYSSFSLAMHDSEIEPLLIGKDQFSHTYNGMTGYLTQLDKTHYPISSQEYMVGGTSPHPVFFHDQPYEPSSPESISSDHSSSTDNDHLMAATSPQYHMLSGTGSAQFGEPAVFSRLNSRSSTFMDAQLSSAAFHGSGMGYYPTTTSTLAAIQGTPDLDVYKNEDEHYDYGGIKMDPNSSDLSHIRQHPTFSANYHNYSPAPTAQTPMKSEIDYDEPSDTDLADAGDNGSDGDYNPSGTRRPTRRIARRGTVSDTPKVSRVTKSKSALRRTSTNNSFKAFTQLSGEHKHPCVFSFAGCGAMWKTKNEWKRHAMTQHLVLESYHCKLCTKEGGDNGKGKGKMGKNIAWSKVGGVDGQVFNRKDLFTQHLKRMHKPIQFRQLAKGGSGQQKKDEDDWIKEQQEKARYDTGRFSLNESTCPKEGCNQRFSGRKGWDERLEHIWKHFERNECVGADMGGGGLREWAFQNGVVVEDVNGNLMLKDCTTDEKMGSEEDAPGDVEY